MNKLSSTDRAALIKLASSLPAGDDFRKAILAGLAQNSSSKQSSAKIRRFTRSDWYGWAGAERFSDGSEPFILEMPFDGDLSEDVYMNPENYAQNSQIVTAIADSEGVGLHFSSDDGDQGPSFFMSARLDPEEAEGTLESVARELASGRLPHRFKQNN